MTPARSRARRAAAVVLASLAWAACSSTTGGGRDDRRFVVVSDAVVRDGRTGFEWTRRDDAGDLGWYAADAYCRDLADDGGGWRLPAIEELRVLYGGPTRVACGDATCKVDPAFRLGSPYVWSATAPHPTTRTYLDFQFGTELSPTIERVVRRVFCVRSSAAARAR